MNQTVYMRFFAPVDEINVRALMTNIDQALKAGSKRVVLLISSPGGSVYYGLSAYNYLKGVPAEIVTHNFGSVDSLGVVLYCAGSTRLCVPHARFLLHGVTAQFPQGTNLEEKQLEERLKSLQIDTENIAGVIAANCGKTEDKVHQAMLDRTTLNPEGALEWGLVHEIKEALLPAGASLITIQ